MSVLIRGGRIVTAADDYIGDVYIENGTVSLLGESLDVTADVTLGPDPAGGFRISGIALSVSGSAQGVTAEDFARIAVDAKAACPVSKALTGTTISLDVFER